MNFGYCAFAQESQKTLKKTYINHFFTCTLDKLLDTLSSNYHLNIVFERDSLSKFDVAEHFFNESLSSVLDKVCSSNDLHYWMESDGTIYILQNTDDLDKLKKLNRLHQNSIGRPVTLNIEKAESPPMHFLFSISGRVIDQNSGESLPSATVKIRNTQLTATTNTDGNFTLFNVPSDTCVVEASYSGYQPDYVRLSPKNINTPLTLSMYRALNTLNEVSIIGKKSGVMTTDTKKVGVLQLTPENLDKMPNLGEKDILRAFQLMPGVGATNESSSGAYVRGGTPDQNLVVFDGFTIYQVDHLYGFFSAFNANAVKDVQLYKGGFSSIFGGRLSSVTEINGKNGNRNEANYGIDLSLLSVNAFAEMPINDKSSLLIAFRRSYQGPLYNKIFKQFNTSTVTAGPGGGGGRPGGGFGVSTTPASHFYDADIKYNYRVDSTNTITWSFYNGADNTDNSRVLNLPSFLSSSTRTFNITDYTKYGNTGSSVKWFRQWNKNIHSNTYITYSSYFNDRNRSTAGSTTDAYGNVTNFQAGTNETNNLKDIGFKSEWEWLLNDKVKFLYGGFGNYQKINYDYIQNDTSTLISQHNSAFLGGGYAELEYDPTNKLHIQPGIRSTFYQPTGKMYYEPRLSASYVINDNYTLKAATGQFYQYDNEVTREDILNGNRNFWVLANNTNIPVSESKHYMGGISYENNQFLIDVEGYYKTLSGLTQYTIRTTGSNNIRSTTASTVQQDFYTGTGFAKGIEILLQKKLGNYTGWIGYTLADAENKFPIYGNNYYPADQDIRHEFKAINMYHYYRWNFSAVFIFSTGHPYTAPLSTYTVTTADGNTVTSFNISGKNTLRLPDYHRLDLSATYDLIKINGNKVGSIGLSLFNVYNHTNIWYREYQLQNNAAIATDVNYLGFTPNITLSLRWK
ncbi:MAG: TonB-dependent Receptor Plug Domain protein [Mucilaginibacter sp.]|nr:TonB-dependent Receptor Plug Domain protein [Mucilaginibacter sp.]MDB5139700.1 TonB-dependent Receptor Plug Domain protein [Mucilaginibacter sp.]